MAILDKITYMHATNFNDSIASEINYLMDFVLKNEYSDFYRKKYPFKKATISSYEDIQNIPILRKTEFSSLEINELTFVKEEEVKYYAASGGTTSGIPTVIPFSDYNFEQHGIYYINEELLRELDVDKVLTLIVPNSAPMIRTLKLPNRNTIVVPGDIYNLKLAAKMANEVQIQGIITSPSRLNEFIPYLKEIGFDFRNIKWLSLGHEFFPSSLARHFKDVFPNTMLFIHYGISEIGGVRAYRCKNIQDESPEIMHPYKELIEIVDENGKTVPFGTLGEIVHTDSKKKAFPLIRYATGDMGRLESVPCKCGNNFRLIIEGRRDIDFVEIDDLLLRSRDIADSVEMVSEFADLRFQLHVLKKKPLELRLDLILKEEFSSKTNDQAFKNNIHQTFSKSLKLSPSKTLLDLTKEGRASLEINFVENVQNIREKAKYIILHE